MVLKRFQRNEGLVVINSSGISRIHLARLVKTNSEHINITIVLYVYILLHFSVLIYKQLLCSLNISPLFYIELRLLNCLLLKITRENKEIREGDIFFAGSGETAEEIGKAVA